MNNHHGVSHTVRSIISPSLFEFICSMLLSSALGIYLVTDMLRRDALFQEYVQKTASGAGEVEISNAQLTALGEAINGSQFIGDATIFFVWALVGLMLYSLVEALWRIILKEVDLVERFNFATRFGKRMLIETTLESAVLRLAALIGLVGFAATLRFTLLPIIFAQFFSVFSSDIAQAMLHAFLGAALTMLCIHVFVVLVRLSLLRTRVFFTKYSGMD